MGKTTSDHTAHWAIYHRQCSQNERPDMMIFQPQSWYTSWGKVNGKPRILASSEKPPKTPRRTPRSPGFNAQEI